jgi:proton-translocating NADH-quinone oxidoreductase chain N
MSSLSAILFLCGIWFIYLNTGAVNFIDLKLISFTYTDQPFINLKLAKVMEYFSFYNRDSRNMFSIDLFLLCGFILISVSIFFKLAIAPFHLWALDVYEGSPIFVMIFLSIIPKIVFLAVFFKLYYIIYFSSSNFFNFLLLIISSTSFIIGALGGLYQIKLKRLLVYSMIYNNGYFLLILSIPSLFNIVTLFYFLFTYLLNLLGLFICILALRSAITGRQLTSIYSMLNLFRVNPLLAFSFMFLLFSLSGIPPLIGFFGKFYLLASSFNNMLTFVLCLSLFTNIINIFYYIRLIKIIIFLKVKNYIFFEPLSLILGIILFIILILLIFILIIPSLFFNNIKAIMFCFL